MTVVDDFETWYRRTHPVVLGVVAMACGDVEIAGDAADEAFTRALDRWSRVSSMASPEAWTCRVAINVMRRRLRRRRIEEGLLLSRSPAPAAQADLYPELWAHVGRLPPRQRMAVVLRYVADMTESDVASVMGVTRGAASSMLTAARSHLADELAPMYEAEESPYA